MDTTFLKKTRKYFPNNSEIYSKCLNGFFFLRTTKSIQQSNIFINSNVYLLPNQKQYIYSNLVEKTKTCVNCLEIKPFSEYSPSSTTRDKLHNSCKKCYTNKQKSLYHALTPEQKKNKLNYMKNWKKQNHNKVKIYKRKQRNKLHNKIARQIRKRVVRVIKKRQNNHYIKEVSSVQNKHLGCTKYELIRHLESKFLPGMTWENYGEWEIDHIKPISNFNFNKPEEVKQINHFTNLLPMWRNDNLLKSNQLKFDSIKDKELLLKYPDLRK